MSEFDPELLVALLAPFVDISRCWVAFSGGLDSTALLTAAAAVRDRLPGPPRAIHVDHGLHPDSPDWARHCQSCCDGLSIPLVIRRLRLTPIPGESIEALAREARYRAFAGLLAPGDLLLTAHNRDDQAETLLLALLRGSGVHGLAAMPLEARLGEGRLVRPLLDVTREALAAYARARGLGWIEDPSNSETALDRNYLRHRVLPRLRERWPSLSTTLSRSAAHCAEAAQLTDRLAAETLVGLAGERPGTLDIGRLMLIERPLQKAVLRLWLRRRRFGVPDTRRLGRVLDDVLPARRDANPLVAWSGCQIRRDRRDLFAIPTPPEPPPTTLEIIWPVGVGCATLELPEGLGWLEWRPVGNGEGVTAERLEDAGHKTLAVRFGGIGQRCRTRIGGHERPLKKVFQEAGVPVWLRSYVPLVFDDTGLIAIAGICDCLGMDPSTELPGELRWLGHPWVEFGLKRV